MTPRVSVVVLSHNYDRFIDESIESVLNQTFRDVELLIADDGSTDGSVLLASRYEGERCRVLRGEHVGLELNLQRALKHCRGELVAITSADDRWLSRHLEIGVAALDVDERLGFSYSLMRPIDPLGRPLDVSATWRSPVFPSGWLSRDDLLPGQFIPTQTTVFRRTAIDFVGGVDPSLHMLELDLILRIVAQYPVAFTGETTAEYRVHGTSLSSDASRVLDARLALYAKHLANEPPRVRRGYEAAAYFKTAYRELVRSPSASATRSARGHITAGMRRDPRAAFSPLHIAMLAAACAGPLYPALYRGASLVTRWRTPKRLLQRALGLAGTSHHAFGTGRHATLTGARTAKRH